MHSDFLRVVGRVVELLSLALADVAAVMATKYGPRRQDHRSPAFGVSHSSLALR
jgi:hypothetical protein